MRPMGRHIAYGGTDAEVGVSAAFATRAFGKPLAGRHLELTSRAIRHPDYQSRQARKLWGMLQRGELHPDTIPDIRRRFARQFAQFERHQPSP